MCSPTFLVQGTAGGKSSMHQTIGLIKGGISIIIENALSLQSDQQSKIHKTSFAVEGLQTIQLDSLKSKFDVNKLHHVSINLRSSSEHGFCIFASLEALIHSPSSSMIDAIASNKTLQQSCADEIHLFVKFAVEFRHSFLRLKRYSLIN